MLEFFRKYQRYLFIFVTVIIIVTFSLFGSYKTFGQTDNRKEIVVGRAIDGSKLKYFEIKQLAALLGAESGQTGVIRDQFLKTGVADQLASGIYRAVESRLAVASGSREALPVLCSSGGSLSQCPGNLESTGPWRDRRAACLAGYARSRLQNFLPPGFASFGCRKNAPVN